MRDLIREECDYIKELLLKKNSDYGNSVFDPIGVFSQLDSAQALRVRIDDKLARIRNGVRLGGDKNLHHLEDSYRDVIGYILLLRIWEKHGASLRLGMEK